MREIMLFLMLISNAFASYEHARRLQQHAQRGAQTTSPRTIPGFCTSTPPEVSFNDHQALESATTHVFSQNKTAKDLKTSAEERPYFKIDSERDPLISHSRASVQTPRAVLSGVLERREPSLTFTTHICLESKPDQTFTCSKSLLPPAFSVEPAKYSNYWCAMGNHRPDDPSCAAKTYFNPARMYEAEKVHIQKETWTSTCQTLEEKERLGLCFLIKKECPGGPETRDVVGTMGEKTVTRPITRDCWREVLTYGCGFSSPNTCESLRNRGCEQVKSECIRKIAGTCVEWKQTFRCRQTEKVRSLQTTPYRLPTTPRPRTDPPNRDLNEAISKLQVLQEVQNELRAEGEATSLPLMFKGQGQACTIAFGGFKNCCTNGSGWGVSLGLSGCDAEERDLAERQAKGLCHEIGTYCAEKALGVCIRKKRSSCCFPSKLARILHEQGRRQLGISWGDAKDPQCRGLSADELARLNFDRLDLREIYQEISTRVQQKATNVVQRNLSDRVQKITQGLTPPQKEM